MGFNYIIYSRRCIKCLSTHIWENGNYDKNNNYTYGEPLVLQFFVSNVESLISGVF